MNQDLLDFIEDVPEMFKPSDQVIIQEYFIAAEHSYASDKVFTAKYPQLTLLLNAARITELSISNKPYLLYAWNNQDGGTMGWLSLPPEEDNATTHLHADHRLLLRYFGGIEEFWNNSLEFYQGEFDTWLANLNSAFCLQESVEGFIGWEKGYEEQCRKYHIQQVIQPRDYISFAFEANGNCTAYHKQTSELLLFAHDHSFEYVVPVKDTPPNTFFHFVGCRYFADWVEQVTQQWMERKK